jgi:hypothetical protein
MITHPGHQMRGLGELLTRKISHQPQGATEEHLQRKNITQSHERGAREVTNDGQMTLAEEPLQLTTLRLSWHEWHREILVVRCVTSSED